MPDADGIATDQEITNIYNLINSGNAFANRVAGSINSFSSLVAAEKALIDAYALMVTNTVPNWSQSDFQDTADALESLQTALGSILTHTNRTAGVGFPPSVFDSNPSLLALLSVAVSLHEVEKRIVGGEVSDVMGNFFGSLTKVDGWIANWTSYLTNLTERIETLVGDEQPLPEDVVPTIQGWASSLSSLIASELSAYNAAIRKLTIWGAATTMAKPQFLWRDFVYENIATPQLQPLIPEVEDDSL